VLKGKRRLLLRRPSIQPVKKGSRRGGGDSDSRARVAGDAAIVITANPEVFEALRSWRMEIAREHAVPAYTVFHDSTLRELARTLPKSLDDLRGITGIGATKLERYGEALVGVVKRTAG
jgi:ATP-dependent DNA helicase RecQ